MKKLLIFALLLCLICGGCGIEGESTTSSDPFMVISCNDYLDIIVDKKTNVMYLRHMAGEDADIEMLVNADGTPRLYDGEFE